MTVRSLPPAAQLCGAYEVRSLQLGDGRSLAYAAMGPPLAQAKLVCLYHHGVPASLVEAEPLAAAGAGLGVAVVAFDRPGMGGSTVDPAMSVASVVADAAALLDHLQLAAAVQVGESGGAPYAAAFAALRPERTAQLLLLAGLAATHGRQHRPLRRSLSSMDRWCMSLRALGASHVINSLVKLAANVSLPACLAALVRAPVPAGCGRAAGGGPAARRPACPRVHASAPATAPAYLAAHPPPGRPFAEDAQHGEAGRGRHAGPLRRRLFARQRRRQGLAAALHAGGRHRRSGCQPACRRLMALEHVCCVSAKHTVPCAAPPQNQRPAAAAGCSGPT